jgi:hypothetical protein
VDGDGTREAHTNSCDGMWSGLRTYLRVFRGVHKWYPSDYVALHEFRVNLKDEWAYRKHLTFKTISGW